MYKKAVSLLTQVKALPLPQVNAANDSFKMLIDAYSSYKHTVQVEKTKRTAIEAWRETKVHELNNQREILEIYLKETFKSVQKTLKVFLQRLIKALKVVTII